MDVLARCVEPPVQGDLRQLWSKSKPRHGGNTLDSFVVDLGSALEDALVLLSTSEQTEKQEESLESRVDDDNNNNDDQSPLDSDYSSSWTFHGSSKKLISAMKGSRKKRGRKVVGRLRVSWAPDVYDPPVTSQSHSAGSSSSSSHNQHSSSRHKKTSKNKANSRKSKR